MSEYYKFIYTQENGFKNIGDFTSHSVYIQKNKYGETIRGIVYKDKKIIYLRINNLFGESLKTICNFFSNFLACVKYTKQHYKGYKIRCSYTINTLPYDLKKEILEI